MKKTFSVFSALCALLLVSCNKEQMTQETADATQRVTMYVSDGKSYIDPDNAIIWGKSEYVSMYYNDGTAKFARSSENSADANDGKSQATFEFAVSPEVADSYTIGGVYPASAILEAATKCRVTVPAVQNATASSYDPAAYVMVIQPQVVTEIPTEWVASFRRAAALNKITLKGVKGDVNCFELKTSSSNVFGGEAVIDLSTGETESYAARTNSVEVRYATALPSGNMDVWFTSWDATIPAGEQVTVTAYTAGGYYQKTITAKAGGIAFAEGKLNTLSVDFSSVELQAYTLKDFAHLCENALEKWETTTTSGKTIGNVTVKGNYIPQDYTFVYKGLSLTRAQAYDYAVNGFNLLDGGAAFTTELPALHSYKYGQDPYNENSGKFANIFVKLDLVRNAVKRAIDWAGNSKILPNNIGYVAGQVTGYDGRCSLERHFLMLMRLYKYLLDNNFESGLKDIENDIYLNAGLYSLTELSTKVTTLTLSSDGDGASADVDFLAIAKWNASSSADWLTVSPTRGNASYANQTLTVTAETNTGSERSATVTITTDNSTVSFSVLQEPASKPTIKDFAQEYVKLLDVWETTIVDMPTGEPYCAIARKNVHSIPMDTKITVKGNEYTVSQMLEIAMRSYLLLTGKNGNDATTVGAGKFKAVTPVTMSADVPTSHSYGIGYWYLDNQNNGGPLRYKGKANQVTTAWITNYVERNVNFANGNGGKWGNMAGYNGGQLTNYTGTGIPSRCQIALIRMFKMLLDNKIESGVADYLSDKVIDSTLYGNETYD